MPLFGTIKTMPLPDLLQLTVWQHPDLSGPVLVRRDGKISVPLVGDIQAEGFTPEGLADQIRLDLSEFIANLLECSRYECHGLPSGVKAHC